MSESANITCPHCAAAIKVDLEAGVVIESQAPIVAKEKIDFDSRLQQIEEEKARASERMAEAMRREQSKERIMEDKFQSLVEKARNSGDTGPPLRDIDLE